MKKNKWNQNHADVIQARKRVENIIDEITPDELVAAVKKAPSLRGMIMGYISELKFFNYVQNFDVKGLYRPDDHNREENKADLCFDYKGKRVRVQLKSIQTNSIKRSEENGKIYATVQNDASDRRKILLPSGETVETTNYKVGDYDVLAVPLYPFCGKWDFAYLLNTNCRHTTNNKYTDSQKQHLLATTETITFPLSPPWTKNLVEILERYISNKKAEGDQS